MGTKEWARVGHLADSASVAAAAAADPCRATVGRFSWSASRGDRGGHPTRAGRRREGGRPASVAKG